MQLVNQADGNEASSPVLMTRRLGKTFRTSWGRRVDALREFTVDIRKGEIFGLLGPNGAGKTTTLKLLLGFMAPSAGEGRIFGQPLGSVEARRRIGFLPENPYFYDYLTPREFLDTCAALTGLPRAGRRERIEETLARVGLDPGEKRRLRKFSKGMLQRVGLAQAILHRPELVILDEPMSGLDPLGRRHVRDLILALRDEGSTILFSSHILPDAETLCDRVGILVRGELTRVGSVRDLVCPGTEGFEIEAADLPPRLLQSWVQDGSARASGERVLIQVPARRELEERIRQVFTAGGVLHAVRPRHRSLEDVFLDVVGQGETAKPKPDPRRGVA